MRLLADDVVTYGDGGGKAPQWPGPIAGAARVAQLFASLGQQARGLGVWFDRQEVNGQPGVVVRDRDGAVVSVWAVEIRDGAIRAIRSVINPDKLRHLGPLADVRALAARRREVSREG